jgi:hypothetical protein
VTPPQTAAKTVKKICGSLVYTAESECRIGAKVPAKRPTASQVPVQVLLTFVGNNSLEYTYRQLKEQIMPNLPTSQRIRDTVGLAKI